MSHCRRRRSGYRPRMRTAMIASLLGITLFVSTPLVHAHATYNASGYGPGVAGSVGNDGSPTAIPPATWTNGGPEGYTGGLPVMWYAGIHSATQVRTIQTGSGVNPPSGSLLQQIATYNDGSDPDLPTDIVLAVGGRSWSDPSNGDQGWGHGLDYGLIHVTPLDEIQAEVPVRLTITLQDDPADGVAVQLAYALYAGWDTNPNSLRHQTFTTNPSPVDNPLGSTGLKLVDFAVATAPGATLSRTYDLDALHDGRYTLLVAALGGVSGQYQLSAGVFPTGEALNEQIAQCTADLTAAQANITSMTSDADGDTVPDQRDDCPGTAAGQFVDRAGCSQPQFCEALPVATKRDRQTCKKADWQNDEPAMTAKTADCAYAKTSRTCGVR